MGMTDNKDKNTVNEALKLPLADSFERDLTAILAMEDEPCCVITLFDLDHFMRVNDQFGYEAGDSVLIETVRYIMDNLPDEGKLYRVAGDEFAILFRDMEKESVFLLMEKIRSGYECRLPDGSQMSISIGVAAAFEDAVRYQELFRKAECAMFRAKLSGRNMVALAREDKMVPKTSHYTKEQLARLNRLSKDEGIGEAILLREALDMLLKKYDK